MKAITLQQPWATLVAVGAKRIETRSWSTSYRGPLAITASKGWPKKAQMIALSSPFIERLNEANYLPDIPLGMVVATCSLVDCLPMEAHICLPGIFDEYPDLNTSQERKFGDFDVFDRKNGRRRWAFVLEDVQHLEKPIPVKGGLNLWEWTSDSTVSERLKKQGCPEYQDTPTAEQLREAE
jgi:hypothetical protein